MRLDFCSVRVKLQVPDPGAAQRRDWWGERCVSSGRGAGAMDASSGSVLPLLYQSHSL